MVVQIGVRYWNKILKSVSRDNMTISPKKYWIFHSRNTFSSSKLETKKTKYYFSHFLLLLFSIRFAINPWTKWKVLKIRVHLSTSIAHFEALLENGQIPVFRGHREVTSMTQPDQKSFSFCFPSPSSLLPSFSPPPTTNPPSSVLLRRSADWHFDLSDATLEYSFSRRAAVLIVFADCNLIVRQRGNWKSVRERVSPILQNLPFESIDFNLSGAKPRNHPFLEPTKMRFRGGALIYRADSRSIVTSAAYLGSDLENFHDSFRSKDVIPHFINRFESLHGYGFEKPF